MWTRAWRFNNVYAYAAIDIVFAVLWFAAFVAVAAWRGRGMGGGDGDGDGDGDDEDDNDGEKDGCDNFEFGSASKCNVAGATIGFGVIICALFIGTSVLSVRAVMHYKRTGVMPDGQPKANGKPTRMPSKTEYGNEDGVWSSNTNDLDRDNDDAAHDPRKAYGQVPMDDDNDSLMNGSGRQPSDPFQDAHSNSGASAHPGRPLSYEYATDTGFHPQQAYGQEAQAHPGASPTGYVAPSALSPTDYGPGGRLNFPQGNYGADFR